jgi:hypothetical protein
MAELRRLGVNSGNFNYKTVTAIEAASRHKLVELLSQGPPKAPGDVLQAAQTEEPEALARKLVGSQRSDDVISAILFSL